VSRQKFILSHGATCNNWQNSWSFVNHEKKFVIFGEWQNRNAGLIFSEDWKKKKNSSKANPGFKESRENIRLVEEEGYRLFVFPMYATDPEAEKPEIHHIEERLFERKLECRKGRNWYAVGDPVPIAASRSTWILQGNPKLFDIDDYLARYPLIYWRTPTNKNRIYLGDRVFMWRAGEDSGIVASGVVVELPTTDENLKHPDALGADLWMAEKQIERRNDPNVPKVGVAIDSVRLTLEEGMIPRSKFLEDSALSGSRIIKLSNGTVFPVTSDEATRIHELWRGGFAAVSDSAEASAIEGDKKLASHRRRERSRFLVAKKIQLARSQGPIRCEVCLLSEDGAYPPTFSSRIFEVHHLQPLSDSDSPVKTTLQDLAIVCANCHRAIHATKSVEENFKLLKQTLSKGRGN
jgi:predicted HNH restriction endonuclease